MTEEDFTKNNNKRKFEDQIDNTEHKNKKRKIEIKEQNENTEQEYAYALLLEGGKIYVGKSKVVYKRITKQHIEGEGSEFTKKHKFLRVIEIRKINSCFDEDNITKEYMMKYGVDNVRGGT
jgi:predicted GIY-YIG superfamily endonuclease